MTIALPLPNLDDRRWADFVDEGRALIPFYAPEWTDHNASDPGISLIELFAWLAEMDVFAVNRVTDAIRRKLLALAGTAPAPPRAATAILQLVLAANTPAQPVPAGLEFAGADPFGATVRFRSTHDVTALPGRIAALVSVCGTTRTDVTRPWQAGTAILPFGSNPTPGCAFLIGLDLPAPGVSAASELALGFVVSDPVRESSGDERSRLAIEAARASDACEPPWTATPCACPCDAGSAPPPPAAAPARGADATAVILTHHDVRLVWELATGPSTWVGLEPGVRVLDGTRSLTLDGRVILSLDGATPVAVDGDERALVWLRVRIARGAYDAAPTVRGLAFNATEVVQSVPSVSSVRLASGAEIDGPPPTPGSSAAFFIALDGAGDIARLTYDSEAGRPDIGWLGLDDGGRAVALDAGAVVVGTGAPAQTITIEDAPLDAATVRVQSCEDGRWRTWTERPDFDASGRPDAHYTVDPPTGTIRFGDGEHGRALPAAASLVVAADLTTAARGNLGAGAINAIADSRHNRAIVDVTAFASGFAAIANVTAAVGGAAAEPLDATIARARDDRERAARAVTLDDFVALAMATPGVRIARAEARANFHPGFPCVTAPGVVTLFVLPFLPAERPVPSRGLRHAVAAYLERRRIIGTRIEVAGPEYVAITVRATVEAVAGARPSEVSAAITEALGEFFHPLRGGPDRSGWPFGRDVYRSEVLQVIDDTPGVAHVLTLELAESDGAPTCGNLCIGPMGLVDAAVFEIDVR